jgi:hypothetical protein
MISHAFLVLQSYPEQFEGKTLAFWLRGWICVSRISGSEILGLARFLAGWIAYIC